MEKSEIIYLASKYAEKGYSYDTIRYGDDLYHLKGDEKDSAFESIMEYMEEYSDYGAISFREKYKDYRLY